MIDYSQLIDELSRTALKPWAEVLPAQIEHNLSHQRYGDLAQWLAAFDALPSLSPSTYTLKSEVSIGNVDDCSAQQKEILEQCLRKLIPWRKGPFQLFGIHIDTEWRSDWKWERLLPHIAPLKNRTILDVGCGNGYHCWRMLGEGAKRVIGIDPSPRFIVQFHMVKKYLNQLAVDILPVGIQELPDNLSAFDTTFSMGVLYHRRSPMDHLRQLRSTLRPGGELILETLIIEGELGQSLVPEGRYAQMNNVWFLPSAPTLISWLQKCGFDNVRYVGSDATSVNEQRATDWMTFQSLENFLDQDNPQLTVEGHPAPLRGIFVARRKS